MRKLVFYSLALLILLLAGPVWVLISNQVDLHTDWRTADRSRTLLAPLPEDYQPALVQIYAARAYNWRGLFGVHMWIATKPQNAKKYTNYQIVGWNQYVNKPVLTIDHQMPDRKWFGHAPKIILQLTGKAAALAIPKIQQASKDYPFKNHYLLWPGPNSNTYVGYVIRHVPELKVDLPSTAIGKTYLEYGKIFALTPSGTGFQISLNGMLGLSLGLYEGIEFNLLGLQFGITLFPPALKWPGVGRIGFK